MQMNWQSGYMITALDGVNPVKVKEKSGKLLEVNQQMLKNYKSTARY